MTLPCVEQQNRLFFLISEEGAIGGTFGIE